MNEIIKRIRERVRQNNSEVVLLLQNSFKDSSLGAYLDLN